MNKETFIFVHDQNIIIDYEKCNKFNELENVKYVFVGNKEIDKIKDKKNAIICRDLPFNIEEYPKLTSYTGWYALWKNNLYNGDFINLFEYDINLAKNFNSLLDNELTPDTKIIGYIPLNVHDTNYLKVDKWALEIAQSIQKNYKVNIYNLIDNFPQNALCTVTSNHTFNKKTFEEYMKWVEPLVEDIKNLEMVGHQIERSISLFYLVNKLDNVKLMNNVMYHFQFDSHKTQGMGDYKFIQNYNSLLQ